MTLPSGRGLAIALALALGLGPVAGLALANESSPPTWTQTTKLTPENGGSYGADVALDGDQALVGAPGEGSGAAYVYTFTDGDWTLEDTLTVDSSSAVSFGWSVDLAGGTAIVGDIETTPFNPSAGPGSAYVFARDASGDWTQQAHLTADDGSADDRFGTAVALDGDHALVGARNHDLSGAEDAGAGYVFEKASGSWSQVAKLTAEDAEASDRLGATADLDTQTALLGAPAASAEGTQSGAAYVFEPVSGTWSQQAQLAPEDGQANDQFGDSLALDAGRALVGATSHTSGNASGAAYLFATDGTTWSQQAKLVDEHHEIRNMGYATALDGDVAVVGGWNLAFAFTAETDWSHVDTLEGFDTKELDQFAQALDVDGTDVLVGAPGHSSTDGFGAGAAYIFEACSEDGPVSQPVHGEAEPIAATASEEAGDLAHETNCKVVEGLENQLLT